MLSSIAVTLGAAALAHALAIRGGCDLTFTVSGGISGSVGQISSGQVRVGGGLGAEGFEISEGSLWDAEGRGCWWTPPTKTLQCDLNQEPSCGFEIACDGAVSYDGQTTFYACQADGSEYNLYLGANGINCVEVTITASGCHASCAPPPPPPPPSGCPTNLNGNYEFPHLIIPVDSSKPDYAPGTSYFGEVSATVSSLFNFDIPSSDAGKKCSLVFLFPEQADLVTSSYTFSGTGGLDFASLKGPASESTTYDNKPGIADDYGTTTVAPGNSYLIATFDCPAGDAIGFEVSAVGDTCLNYFQDYNPSPIGLYITTC